MSIFFQGKFGQRTDLSKTEYFTKPKEMYECLFDTANTIVEMVMVSECKMRVSYRKRDEFLEDTAFTNPIIAAWVTAQARLKLYSYLERLQERVIYMDTGTLFDTCLIVVQ